MNVTLRRTIGTRAARISFLLMPGLLLGGCPTPNPGNSNSNTNGGGGQTLQAVVTDHVVDGEIKIGDGFVAFGTSTGSRISFIRQGQGGGNATNLSNSLTLLNSGFNVAGTWIAAREFDGSVHLYNTANNSIINVDPATLSLPSGNAAFDEFAADGQFLVIAADPTPIDVRRFVWLIDCSQNPPVITPFTQVQAADPNFPRTSERSQSAIDSDARQFVVQVGDALYRYSFDDPTGAPEIFDFSQNGGIDVSVRMFFEAGLVLYHDRDGVSDGRHVTRLADLSVRQTTSLTENPSSDEDVYLEGGLFGYFVQQTDADIITNTQYRSVFGRITAAGPEFTRISLTNDPIVGGDRDDGNFGYGQTLAITPSGKHFLVAGDGTAANIAEYLQISTNGGAFRTVRDPEDSSAAGIFGSNVVATDQVAAFTTLYSRLAFVVLP